ncbi:MAG: hypothetical protein SNI70_09310 [Rikenellaceae bacterium]
MQGLFGGTYRSSGEFRQTLVVEEFGLPRDDYQIKRGSTTTCRDRLYKTLFDAILKSSKEEGVFAGCNFWSWGGEAAQIEGQEFWQRGMDYAGDPPQEAQGLNSVYIDDTTTLEIIKKYITLTDE